MTQPEPAQSRGIMPSLEGTEWIDSMTDDQCMEVFWLYVDPPEPFLEQHAPALLGAALRRALREVAANSHHAPPGAPRP